MGTISVFNHVTIDGFFAGPNGEIDWFKAIRPDDEYFAFTHDASGAGNTLVFGHTTYDMMRAYWPTDAAINADPMMAASMNDSSKIVFSKSPQSVATVPLWKSVKVLPKIEADEVKKLKETGNMTVLGSGSVVQELTNLGLVDEYCLILVPIVLGAGKPMFAGVKEMDLELVESRSFKNGLTVQRYKPSKD